MIPRHQKFFYAAGPGDIVTTFQNWSARRTDPNQLAQTYSAQFFDLCAERDATAWAVSSCPRKETVRSGRFLVRNCPKPLHSRGRFTYALNQFIYGVFLLLLILRLRPDAAIIADGSASWWTLIPARLLGVRIVPSLHCVLFSGTEAVPSKPRLKDLPDAFFFSRVADSCLCVSGRVGIQLDALTGGRTPWKTFLPTYPVHTFEQLPKPVYGKTPFRLLYSGRVEADKGVFLLVDAVEQLVREKHLQIHLDICGDGNALPALHDEIHRRNLSSRIALHGHCQSRELHDFLARSHVLVVPTTSHFVEGFNKVVAEGILAGRPVIATRVCPATDLLGDALLTVEPDCSDALLQPICRLADDPALFERLRQATLTHRDRFFDPRNSWKETLNRTLADPQPPTQPATRNPQPTTRNS